MTRTLVNTLSKNLDADVIETHISWLLLARDTVYKLKKPVDLGFADFTSLDKRREACEAELRLNRRTAPELYEAVVAISGSETAPTLEDESEPIDYAVRMRRFDDDMLFDRLARQGKLDANDIVSLADAAAGFHQAIRGPRPPEAFGTPEAVREPALQNFTDIEALENDPEDATRLAALKSWTEDEYERRRIDFSSRLEQGFVRECHGDMHLGNMFRESGSGRAVLFDCIEFNASLRWTDVASDVAFAMMDLASHDLRTEAHRLNNEYLARTGDYGALRVLDFYLVYRALVRAKVAAIRAQQDDDDAGSHHDECRHYLELATTLSAPRQTGLVLMCGLSGTGKTTVARELAANLGAIHLRSDVERKRLYGLHMTESSHADNIDIYTTAASERTFSRLEELATASVETGRCAVVDATFIGRRLRRRFTSLAERLKVPWTIVECTASEQAVRRRLEDRRGDASEAGIQQYLDQRRHFDAFDRNERGHLVSVDTEREPVGLAERVHRQLTGA